MAQRDSGYTRKRNDAYYTPGWVTQALIKHIPPRINEIWEPACGRLSIVSELRNFGYEVIPTDLKSGNNFLKTEPYAVEGVVTNPPFKLAADFIIHALAATKKKRGFVAMLLATDFDHAKTRQHLFGGCDQFAKKLVLTKRIVWFEPMIASPSSNHAWFMWDWRWKSVPQIRYHYEKEK